MSIEKIDISLPFGWYGCAYLDDMGDGCGRLTLQVDDVAVTHCWSSMGRPLRAFLLNAQLDSIFHKLWRGPVNSEVIDGQRLILQLKKALLSSRRKRLLTPEVARDGWNAVQDWHNDGTHTDIQVLPESISDLAADLLGEEWFLDAPMQQKFAHLHENMRLAIMQLKEKLGTAEASA